MTPQRLAVLDFQSRILTVVSYYGKTFPRAVVAKFEISGPLSPESVEQARLFQPPVEKE